MSGAQSCLGHFEEHLDPLIIVCKPRVDSMEGQIKLHPARKPVHVTRTVPNSDLPAELKLCAADARPLPAIYEGAVVAPGVFT